MSDKTVKIIRTIYSVLMAVLVILSGICLASACLKIYSMGDRPFSPESIYSQFKVICPVIYTTVAAIIVGIFLSFVLPTKKEKPKRTENYAVSLKKLTAKTDLEKCDETTKAAVLKERKLRTIAFCVSLVLCTVFMAAAAFVILDTSRYSLENYSSEIASVMLITLPLFLAAVCTAFVYGTISSRSCLRELTLLKGNVSKSKDTPKDSRPCKDERKMIWVLRTALFAAAVLLIIIGILNGGMRDVLGKAIKICTECIGLG